MYGYGNSFFLATHGILARGGGVAPSLLLDTYPNASVAYSLRKLRSDYTGSAIRVRRSVDNAEQDIAFVANELDTTTMLDFVGYNLWTYSEDISQAVYSVTGSTKSSDVETAPDGNLTGDKVVENTAFSEHGLNRASGTILNATSYTTSAYFKQAERTKIRIFSNISGANQQCDLDLTNGSVSNSTFTNTPVVTAEANGWYRFSVTITSGTTSATNGMTFRLLNASNATTYTGDGTSGVYVWGYQLSQTSSVKTYQKTVATAGGNGFVSIWYDQSTNVNNSIQTSPTSQAQVVLNGNLILDVDTSKITTTWTADSYSLTNSIAIAQGNYQIGVFRRQTTATRIISLASTSSTPLIGLWGITDVISTNYGGGAINHQTNTGTGKYLLSIYRDTSNNVSAYLNNTALTGGTDSTTGQNITRFGVSGASPTVGQKQELVYWNNDQSANRTGIETNVNTYWNAY